MRLTLNITAGNDKKVVLWLLNGLHDDGREPFPVELSEDVAVKMVSEVGTRHAVSFVVGDEGRVLLDLKGSDYKIGLWGIEVVGWLNGAKWRAYGDSMIQYTPTTERGAELVTDFGDGDELTLVVGYVTAFVPKRTSELTNDGDGQSPFATEEQVAENVGALQQQVADKVDKVTGKGLSTNDFTDEEKQKIVNLDGRLATVEELATLSIEGQEIGIASASDFDNPDATKRAKVPTVGAILDCMDPEPTSGSTKPVQSGGVWNALANRTEAQYTEVSVDISGVPTTSLGYNVNTGKMVKMSTGFYSKFIPVKAGYYKLTPISPNYRVSMMSLKSIPGDGDTADIGRECLEQYGVANPYGELGETMYIHITESKYLYVRCDTKNDALSRIGEVFTYEGADVSMLNSLRCPIKTRNYVIHPVTEAECVILDDSNVKEFAIKTQRAIGMESCIVTGTSSFEAGGITAGSDVSSDSYIRTPMDNPIPVSEGISNFTFTVPTARKEAYSAGYAYKDGVYVRLIVPSTLIDNGTSLSVNCDGSFNQVRFRVYVNSVAQEDVSRCSVAYRTDCVGIGILGELEKLKKQESANDNSKTLFTGILAQSSYGSNGATLDNNPKKVCMADVLQVPFSGITLYFKTEAEIKVGLRLGSTGVDMGSVLWMNDGFSTVVDSAKTYYQIVFERADGDDLPIETVEEMLSKGKIAISYKLLDYGSIIGNNRYAEKAIYAFANERKNSSIVKHPILVHTSDQHGNVVGLKNVFDYAAHIGADAIVNTGDICVNTPANGVNYAASLSQGCDIPVIVSVGNHDGYQVTGEQEIRDKIIDLFVDDNYHIPVGKTYYYYDIPSINTRIISLNSSQTGYSVFNEYGCIMQDQIDFFVDSLMSVPDGYGVVISIHFPLVKKNLLVSNDYGFLSETPEPSFMKTMPFASALLDIVDAYIGRSTFDVSYVNVNDGKMNEGSGSTVAKTGDFSTSKGEFLCWMTGHVHEDRVAYFDTTHKQLCLSVNCTASCPRQTVFGDLPREGAASDCFNVYVVNRDSKTLHIIRVGSDFTCTGKERKIASIQYAD